MAEDKISQDEIRQNELEQDIKILKQSLENVGSSINQAQYRKLIRERKQELKKVKKRIKAAKRH